MKDYVKGDSRTHRSDKALINFIGLILNISGRSNDSCGKVQILSSKITSQPAQVLTPTGDFS